MRSAFTLGLLLLGLTSCGASPDDACRQGTCQGCCTAAGKCESGTSQLACGQRGDQCTQCTLGTSCNFGLCTANTTSGGGSGATGGGSGGGATGGGSGGGATGGGGGGSVTGGGGGSATGGGGGSVTGGGGGSATGGGGGSATGGGGGSVTGGGGGSVTGGGSGGGTACVTETDAQFCARLQYDCDLVSAFDNCGTNRSVNCGTCTGGKTCGGGGQMHVCGTPCVPEDNLTFCARLNVGCGTKSAPDNCNTARAVDCGGCTPSACQLSSACVNNTCVITRQPQGFRCGQMGSIADRNFCLNGSCVTAYSYCGYVGGSGLQWTYQRDGWGNVANGPCSCTTPNALHFEYNIPGVPMAPENDFCDGCVVQDNRAVCF